MTRKFQFIDGISQVDVTQMKKFFQEEAVRSGRIELIAEDMTFCVEDENVIGYFILVFLKKSAFLFDMEVVKEYKKNPTVNKAFVDEIVNRVRKKGIDIIMFTVESSNNEMVNFHIKRGAIYQNVCLGFINHIDNYLSLEEK